MRFKITRSSDNYCHDIQPHPNAVDVTNPVKPETIAEVFEIDSLRERTTIHRWEIEINSLEELLEIAKLDPDGVIVTYYEGEPELEIYDDWRE